MMTREKAAAFLRGFDMDTRLRWWVTIADWRWPADIPFFAKPIAMTSDRADTLEQQNALLEDDDWKWFFFGLHDVTTYEQRVRALAFSEAMQAFYHQIDTLLHIVDATKLRFDVDPSGTYSGNAR